MRSDWTPSILATPPRAARCLATISSTVCAAPAAGRRLAATRNVACAPSGHWFIRFTAPPRSVPGARTGDGPRRPAHRLRGPQDWPGAPPPPQRDAVLGLFGGGRLGLRRSLLGFASAVLGLPHAGLRLDLLPVGRHFRRTLAQDRVALRRRHPLAVELDVAARSVALLLAHPAAVDRHAAQRAVRLRVVGRHRQHPRVRLACLRREALVGGPAAERLPASGVRC